MRWFRSLRTRRLPDRRVTLTLRRPAFDITATVEKRYTHTIEWTVADAVDEEGHPVALTVQEHQQLCQRAAAGEDESGDEEVL